MSVNRNVNMMRDNFDYLKIVQDEASKATYFAVTFLEHDGLLGIWLKDGDAWYLINPIELVSSLYREDDYCNLATSFNKDKKTIYLSVKVTHDYFHIRWNIRDYKTEASVKQFSFAIDNYVERTRVVVTDLYIALLEQKELCYRSHHCDKQYLRMCLDQMKLKALLPSCYYLSRREVFLEDFVFIPDAKSSEDCTIGIGKRCRPLSITYWNNDYEKIRHQLENYVMDDEAKIVFRTDGNETELTLKRTDVLDYKELNLNGSTNYKYINLLSVSIYDEHYYLKPVIKGFCQETQVIRTLYEGLLKMALNQPLDGKDSDELSRLATYNKYKSAIIENYLAGVIPNDDQAMVRQYMVKHILTFEPDYDVLLKDEEGMCYSDTLDLLDKEGRSIDFPELADWQQEMQDIVVASETGEPYSKNWTEYHKRGLLLAHKLRERLSTDYDLWYKAPFEDKSGAFDKYILIINTSNYEFDSWQVKYVPKDANPN